MDSFPSVDLTDFGLLEAAGTARRIGERSLGLARDATYTAVGLGVLAFHRVQVRRRELERAARR